jgi:hypothetical protein
MYQGGERDSKSCWLGSIPRVPATCNGQGLGHVTNRGWVASGCK